MTRYAVGSWVGTCPYVHKVFCLKEIAKQSLQFGTAVTSVWGLKKCDHWGRTMDVVAIGDTRRVPAAESVAGGLCRQVRLAAMDNSYGATSTACKDCKVQLV
jgi:hypothetical protein